MAKKPFRFAFDPRRKGIRKVLGDLEAEIMEIVWDRGETTVREVCARIGRRRDLAYTTVMTVMSRLAAKGLLQQTREDGAYRYRAVSSREDFTRGAVGLVVDQLLADFATPTMSHFVDSISRDDGKIEALEELVREAKKERAARRKSR